MHKQLHSLAAQFGVAAVVGDSAIGSFVRVLVLVVLWLRVHHVFFPAEFYLKKSTADGQNVYPRPDKETCRLRCRYW